MRQTRCMRRNPPLRPQIRRPGLSGLRPSRSPAANGVASSGGRRRRRALAHRATVARRHATNRKLPQGHARNIIGQARVCPRADSRFDDSPSSASSGTVREHLVRILCEPPSEVLAKFRPGPRQTARNHLSRLPYFQRSSIPIRGTPFPNEGRLSVRIPSWH